MARLFLTNIDLNTNELQNAVVQNLSSAPLSGNKEGRIYYDVTNKALYLYTDGQWKPLASGGAAASSIELTGDVTGTANVDPATGKLTVSTTVDSSFVTLTGTQTLTNKTIGDALTFNDGANNSTIDVDGNNLYVSANNNLTLSTANGDVILNPDGSAYIGNNGDSQNRIATLRDIAQGAITSISGTTNEVDVTMNGEAATISLPNTIYKPTTFSLGYQEGFDITFSGDTGDTYLNQTTGDGVVHVLGTFTVDYGSTNNPQYSAFRVDPSGALTDVRNALRVQNDNGMSTIYINGNTPEIGLNNTSEDRVLTLGTDGYNASVTATAGNLNLSSSNQDVNIDAFSYINLNNDVKVYGDVKVQDTLQVGGWNGHDGIVQVNDSGNVNKLYVDANNNELTLNNYARLFFNNNNGQAASIQIDDNLIIDGQYGVNINSWNGNSVVVNSQGILYLNSNDHVQINPALNIGGSGTNGSITVQDSNSNNLFSLDGSGSTFSGNVTIGGDLNVTGTLNAVNRTEINIEDNTIRLNTGFTGTPSVDAGIIVERGTANDTAIIWNEANDQWTLSNDGNNYYAIARKYVEVIGDASNTSFDVIHNLGTRDITVMVRENNAEYNVVETDVLMKDNNTVTIGFTDAPALNSYKVIIVG